MTPGQESKLVQFYTHKYTQTLTQNPKNLGYQELEELTLSHPCSEGESLLVEDPSLSST